MPEKKFEVRESKMLNFFVGIFFLAMGLGILFTKISPILIATSVALGAGGAFFIIRGLKKRVLMSINDKGIFYRGVKVCTWQNFYQAFIAQEYPNATSNLGLSDRNYIVVEYSDMETDELIIYKIPMQGTQNKSEEEIIDAIQLFSGKPLSYEVYTV